MNSPLNGTTYNLKVYLHSDNAQIPKRADEGAAGYDLYASEDVFILSRERKLVSTDISIQLPHETYGRIAPRSGMSVKGYDIGAGVIDESYTGIIKVLLINNSNDNKEIKKGDRIAQLIIEKCYYPNIEQVHSMEEFRQTTRGEGGFGSTGK